MADQAVERGNGGLGEQCSSTMVMGGAIFSSHAVNVPLVLPTPLVCTVESHTPFSAAWHRSQCMARKPSSLPLKMEPVSFKKAHANASCRRRSQHGGSSAKMLIVSRSLLCTTWVTNPRSSLSLCLAADQPVPPAVAVGHQPVPPAVAAADQPVPPAVAVDHQLAPPSDCGCRPGSPPSDCGCRPASPSG